MSEYFTMRQEPCVIRMLFNEVHPVLNLVTSNWQLHLVISDFLLKKSVNVHPANASVAHALYFASLEYTFIHLAELSNNGNGSKRVTTLVNIAREKGEISQVECENLQKLISGNKTPGKVGQLRKTVFGHNPIKVDRDAELKKVNLKRKEITDLINRLYEVLGVIAAKKGFIVAQPDNLREDAIKTAEKMFNTFEPHPVDAIFRSKHVRL